MHATPRELRTLLLVAALATLSGCAVGSSGVVSARHTRTPSAHVIDVYTFGLHVRPSAFDRGATLGYRHATYIYPSGGWDALTGSSRREWLRCKLPPGSPILLASRSTGLELQATERVSRLSLGYLSQTTLSSPVRPEESCVLQIDYEPAQPENTTLAILTSANRPPSP